MTLTYKSSRFDRVAYLEEDADGTFRAKRAFRDGTMWRGEEDDGEGGTRSLGTFHGSRIDAALWLAQHMDETRYHRPTPQLRDPNIAVNDTGATAAPRSYLKR